jgi:hypothetical protein
MINLKGTKEKDMAVAESLGHIKTMPVAKTNILAEEFNDKVVDNPEDFRVAIGHAQLSGKDYIEVSEPLFNYLVKNNQTEYLTYGSPGVKVFKEGTKDKILNMENLPPEENARQRLFNK